MKIFRVVFFTIAMVVAFAFLDELVFLAQWQQDFLAGSIFYIWAFVLVGRVSDVVQLSRLQFSTSTFVLVLLLIIVGISCYTLQTEVLHWNWLEDDTVYPSYQHGWVFLSDLLLAVVLAPVVEEVFFRRWMFGVVTKKLNQPVGMVLVAIAFALLHGDVFGAFIFSIVMSLMYRCSGSLALPIAMHALHNGLLIILQWSIDMTFMPDPEPAVIRFVGDYPFVLAAILAVALVLLGLLTKFTLRNVNDWPAKKPLDEAKALMI